jgi:hypothetical protein
MANCIAVGVDPFPVRLRQASHSNLEATAAAYTDYD